MKYITLLFALCALNTSAQLSLNTIGGAYIEDTEDYGMATNGTICAIGSTSAAFVGTSVISAAGMVRVYMNDGNSWSKAKQFYAPVPKREYAFGASIAMNNDFLFITESQNLHIYAIGDEDTNFTLIQTEKLFKRDVIGYGDGKLVFFTNPNELAIWEEDNGTWKSTNTISLDLKLPFQCTHIEVKDDWIFCGIPDYEYDVNGENRIRESGIVAAYRVDANGDYQLHNYIYPEIRVGNSEWGYGELFGGSLSYENNWLAIGATQAIGEAGRSQGAVYIFQLVDENFIQKQIVRSAGDYFLEYFGAGVTLKSGNLLVGNKEKNPVEGAATVYHYYRNDLSQFEYIDKAPGGGLNISFLEEGFLSTYSTDEDVTLYEGSIELHAASIGEKNKTISIYPNPSNGTFFIEGVEDPNTLIKIYDLNGILVYKSTLRDQNINLANGIYFLQVNNTDGVFFQRISIAG